MNHSTAKRRPICVLRPEVIERIAAGEVIERPSSVVRELVENALDAHANHVQIELRGGGTSLVQVTDDGEGIERDALTLAIASHATSKVLDLADLDRIQTLGFRGEALASIAAVAELELRSAADETGTGHSLLHVPGREVRIAAVGHARGTTVCVRDLFHQMPARLAQLRGSQTERSLALDIVRAYALTHPHVAFTVIADGSLVLSTSGTRAHDVVGAIYGMDVAQSLLPLGPVAVPGGNLTGWISPRAITHANRRHVILCVNGRPVHHRTLSAAIEAGYRPLLRKGRHPLLLLHLLLESSLIDPNIHPAKAELLIRNERAIGSLMRESVHAALGQSPASAPEHMPFPGQFRHPVQYALPVRTRRRAIRIEEPLPQSWRPGATDDVTTSLPQLSPFGQLANRLIVAQSVDGALCLVDQHRAHERLLFEALDTQRSHELPDFGAVSNSSVADMSSTESGDPGEDGHDVHGQLLLEPLIIELTPLQAHLLSHRLHELGELGLVCEPFGGATFLVRALPSLPGAYTGLAAFARGIAADAAEDSDDWLERFRISLACRAALRRGQPLSLSEQRKLLNDLAEAKVPAICPHGSPIVFQYTASQLERMFEW